MLGPLLFILYINDLNKAIMLLYIAMHTTLQMMQIYSTVINLLKINRRVKHDLKHLCQWLRSYKISLNTSKTEIVIFKHKQTNITKHMNSRVSGQRTNTTTSVKYLGVYLNDSLIWEIYFKNLLSKLSRAIGFLSKVRHYMPKFLLKQFTILSLICTLFMQTRFGGK